MRYTSWYRRQTTTAQPLTEFVRAAGDTGLFPIREPRPGDLRKHNVQDVYVREGSRYPSRYSRQGWTVQRVCTVLHENQRPNAHACQYRRRTQRASKLYACCMLCSRERRRRQADGEGQASDLDHLTVGFRSTAFVIRHRQGARKAPKCNCGGH